MEMQVTGIAGAAVCGRFPMHERSVLERILIRSWEYRHLRFWAGLRIGGGLALTACGVLTLAIGGSSAKTYGWAVWFLAAAALNFAFGSWQISIARSLAARA
jgi:hypothetical protein